MSCCSSLPGGTYGVPFQSPLQFDVRTLHLGAPGVGHLVARLTSAFVLWLMLVAGG